MKFSVELEREDDSEMFEDLERYLKYHPTLTRFLFNPAGFTFLAGWLLFLGASVGLLGIAIVDPAMGARVVTVIATEVTAGREVAIPVGLDLGVPVLIVFGIAATQDLVTTSWIYPVFYLFRKRTIGTKGFFGYFFAKMERAAARNKAFVERWGAVGLFFFMLIPFAVNGPLIGAILGKLAGIRTRYILPTVVLATVTGAGIWTVLYRLAQPQVEAFSAKYGGIWVKLAVLAIFLYILLRVAWAFWRDVHTYRRIQARREALAQRGTIAQTLHAASEAPQGPESPRR